MGKHRKPERRRTAAARTAAVTGLAGAAAAGGILTAGAASADSSGWSGVRQCESGGNYATNTGNGYYGAYQFDLATWQSLGFSGLPSNASSATQDQAAQQLYAQRGSAPWPVCGRNLSGSAARSTYTPTTTYQPSTSNTSSASTWAAPPAPRAAAQALTAAPVAATAAPWLTVALVGRYRADVWRYQQRLVQLGYRLSVDGAYGPQTAAVTSRYEQDHGLHVESPGIAGPQVWTHIWS